MDPCPLHHQQAEVHLAGGPGARPDHRDPAAGVQALEVVHQVDRADQLEDDVERPVLAEPVGLDHRRAERRHPVAQLGVAHGGGDPRAGRAAELDGRGSDPTGGAVHEQVLAGEQAGLGEDGVVRGGEDLRDAARLDPGQTVGHRHQNALVHERELRLTATADDAHHPVTGGEALGAGAAGLHLAGQLEPGDVLRGAGGRRIVAAQLHHVGAVESRRADADEHLAVAGLGVGMLLDAELLLTDGDGAHGRRPTRGPARPRTRCAGSAGTCPPGARAPGGSRPRRAERRWGPASSGCRTRRRSAWARSR